MSHLHHVNGNMLGGPEQRENDLFFCLELGVLPMRQCDGMELALHKMKDKDEPKLINQVRVHDTEHLGLNLTRDSDGGAL